MWFGATGSELKTQFTTFQKGDFFFLKYESQWIRMLCSGVRQSASSSLLGNPDSCLEAGSPADLEESQLGLH